MKSSFNVMKYFAAFLLLASIVVSCKDDDVPNPNAEVNNWIYDVMKDIYYWTDHIPSNVNNNLDPSDYFDSLLYSGDRFSFIVPNYDELISSLNGVNKEAGYEFLLSRVSQTSSDVVAIVLYVKKNSPAAAKGLKRGDIIKKINNQQITTSNYRDLIGKLSSTHSISFARYNPASAMFEDQPAMELNVVELAENPNFIDTVYTLPSGKLVGYYMYNFFSPGATETGKEYDQEMDQIIANFKSKGVTDIILDLRYNSGGAISSATNLGSLLGKGVSSTKIFYENRWNQLYQNYIESRNDGDAILRGRFKDKAENIGNNLSSGRLYVLVGSRTASASELIINGLRPYMDVYLIGETTVGKNVGSIPINDEDNPDNPYGMLPIVFQIYNSQGSSNYAQGFIPNREVDDFTLPMKALGDINEALLATALEMIDGTGARIGRWEKADKRYQVEPIMSSIDNKVRSNRLIFDLPTKRIQ